MLHIQNNIQLLSYNTLRVPASAKHFIEIQEETQIFELLQNQIFENEKHIILSGGANTLFIGDFNGLVIKMDILGKEICNETEEKIEIKIGAGENRDDFVRYCNIHNRAGIENLINIPGNVGTSAVSNIGAYGVEIKEFIKIVHGIDLQTGEKKELTNAECEFAYRESIFKNKRRNTFLITHITFQLPKRNEKYHFNTQYKDIEQKLAESNISKENLTLTQLSDIIEEIRNQKLPNPKDIGTAGSFFKNPEISQTDFSILLQTSPNLSGHVSGEKIKLSAGQLIELAGMKGYTNGKCGTSPKHALIIINETGTGEEIRDVAKLCQKKVQEMFGISLEPEVIYVE